MIHRRNPAAARYARESLEKELSIRFLAAKIKSIRTRLENVLILKAPEHRYAEIYGIMTDVAKLDDTLTATHPHKRLTAYSRKGLALDEKKEGVKESEKNLDGGKDEDNKD